MPIVQSRRHFLTNVALAGAAGLGGVGTIEFGGVRKSYAAEPPPEVTAIRFDKDALACIAPQYMAEDLLHAEGFTDVGYIPSVGLPLEWIAKDESHWTLGFVPELVLATEAGAPVTALAGVHPGCFELLAHEPIRSVADLKGKTVGARSYASSTQVVRIMARLVGLDPDKDIHWAVDPLTSPMRLFIEGKIDAFLTAAPRPQELRARNIGHSIVNIATDRPWSQYFCCMVTANTNFVRKYPVATKRALRALLMATDICAADPERAARLNVDRGSAARYDYELQALKELRFGVWRDYSADDSMRFWALRLNEVGAIRSSPQKIISQGCDWRFFDAVRRELKA